MESNDVEKKVRSGEFKISSKRKGRSKVWNIFSEIIKEDGSTLPHFVYCRICNNIYKFNGQQTSNLVRHKCYLEKDKGMVIF